MGPPVRAFRLLALLPLSLLLAGCEMVVMQPSGDIAAQQRDLVVVSTALMLIIIVPVIAPSAMMMTSGAAQITTSSEVEWCHSGSYFASRFDER